MEIIIGIGTNKGDRLLEIHEAKRFLSEFGEVESAPLYSCPAFGFESDFDFINTAVLLTTNLDVYDLLRGCLDYELARGRKRMESGFSDRPVDLDLLIATDLMVQEPELVVPHPFLQDRIFAVQPASDLRPNWMHPRLGRSLFELCRDCRDKTPMTPYEV